MTCKCTTVKEALGRALNGIAQPHCPEHDPAPVSTTNAPLALNDDAALASKVLGNLSNKENF